MHGSQLFGQQPSFRGADFGIPEVAYFGFAQFHNAMPTTDGWDEHDGIELVFVCTGEASWEHADDRMLRLSGGNGIVFPAHHRHRILHGVYPPCRIVWIVFHSREVALRNGRLFPADEIAGIYDLATERCAPIRLTDTLMRSLARLGDLATDERLMIGTPLLMADMRALFYSAVVDFWKAAASGRPDAPTHPMVRDAEIILRTDSDVNEHISSISKQLGYRRSHLYNLFKHEIGMTPNDYRQRARVSRSCDLLVHTNLSITSIAMQLGYSTSQYYSRIFRKYVGFTPSQYRKHFGKCS